MYFGRRKKKETVKNDKFISGASRTTCNHFKKMMLAGRLSLTKCSMHFVNDALNPAVKRSCPGIGLGWKRKEKKKILLMIVLLKSQKRRPFPNWSREELSVK